MALMPFSNISAKAIVLSLSLCLAQGFVGFLPGNASSISDLPAESIRFISGVGGDETPTIDSGVDVFGPVADVLGLTPDSRVKVLICVEGPTDVDALSHLSAALHAENPAIPNLLVDRRFAFVPLGGSTPPANPGTKRALT